MSTSAPPAAAAAASAAGDSNESPKQHPLNTPWCFWLRNSGGRSNEWSAQQTLAHTFSTVEDFWCMVNNLVNPFDAGQSVNVDYSIFRQGVNPDYDDPHFKNGGRIILKPSSQGSRNPQRLFEVWVHLLLALIGENFDDIHGSCTVGVRLVAKRQNVKIEIWTTEKSQEKLQPLTEAIVQLVVPVIDLGRPAAEFESFDKSVSLKVGAKPTGTTPAPVAAEAAG